MFDVRSNGIVLEVVLHFGTLIAILFYYYKDIIFFVNGLFSRDSKERTYAINLMIGILPAIIVGFLFKDQINIFFRIELVSISLFITGCFLLITKFNNSSKQITLHSAILVGLFQILALLPGISRSGITISVAMILGVDRKLATKFSFFMAIPMLIGAMVLQIPDLVKLDTQNYIPMIFGFLASAISGYYVVKWLIKLISQNHFWKFSIYCWILSIVLYIYK